MSFTLPKFNAPDFSEEKFIKASNVKTSIVEKDGVAPKDFFMTSIHLEYFKVNDQWIFPTKKSMDCVAVIRDKVAVEVIEIRNLKVGDEVILGRLGDIEEGIYTHIDAFDNVPKVRVRRSVESSFSKDYKELYELLQYEKENNGHILWVLGPAVIFDHDTRVALSKLAENGYVHSLLAGNAMATHDLEGGLLQTALGQNIYTQESVYLGHYNHLDLLNEARRAGSTKNLLEEGNVKDGFVKTCVENNIPIVLAGSIRDDGPLPEVYGEASKALDAMKEQTEKATVIIALATVLHSVATAHLSSTYKVVNDEIRPVYMYSVDISEYAVNKVAISREFTGVKTIVTNVQDFVVNVQRSLVK